VFQKYREFLGYEWILRLWREGVPSLWGNNHKTLMLWTENFGVKQDKFEVMFKNFEVITKEIWGYGQETLRLWPKNHLKPASPSLVFSYWSKSRFFTFFNSTAIKMFSSPCRPSINIEKMCVSPQQKNVSNWLIANNSVRHRVEFRYYAALTRTVALSFYPFHLALLHVVGQCNCWLAFNYRVSNYMLPLHIYDGVFRFHEDCRERK
jgi:hypothetical protein